MWQATREKVPENPAIEVGHQGVADCLRYPRLATNISVCKARKL